MTRLDNALRPSCVSVGRAIADKSSALREIAELARDAATPGGFRMEEVLAGLQQREDLGSTGFGNQIAIPHCRLESAQEFVVGLVSVPEGVDFDSIDGEPVRLIAFMVGPETTSNEHIHMLSAISQALSDPDAVAAMVAAPSPEALREAFFRYARSDPAEESPEGRSLFHLVVQDEDTFHDLLRLLSEIPSVVVSVVPAEHSSLYLSKIPLFADLWRDRPRRFIRILLAIVGKRITNETIRRIERAAGPLQQRRDLLLTVQELFYCAGGLDG
jgi:mannitol/fructose-specific phosphotransferase system IIA component (Ntr-type)